jgi:hypothetical protein
VIAAYALPAVAAWMLLGLVLGALPLSTAALVLIAAYGACYGLAEAAGRPGVPAPGSRWQVPQSMVAGVSGRRLVLVWGSILGPGFATRNPYAGFAVLPLGVAASGGIAAGVALAAAIGAVHGTGRAFALLRDAWDLRSGAPADHLGLVLKSMQWRTFDGFALLLLSGVALAVCLQRF